jgi:competence protein ComEC
MAQQSIITKCALGVDISFRAKVLTADYLPTEQWRLAILVDAVGDDACVDSIHGMKLRVAWQTGLSLAPGDIIQVAGRFKPPRGTANPGAFNYRRWLLAKGYAGTGYLRSGKLLASASKAEHIDLAVSSALLRKRVASSLEQSGLVYAPILSALVIGESGGLKPNDWSTFRATGTIHLMVISGLHIAVVAFMAYWLLQLPLRLMLVFTGTRIDHQIVLVGTLLATFAFALITGLGAPALRVCLMLLLGLLANYCARKPPVWYLLGLAFALSLVFQPLSLFSQGFWLSYFAVAGLLWAFSPRSNTVGPIVGFLLAQAVVLLWLSPILGLLVGEVSLLALPANLLALPIITLVTLPSLIIGLGLYGILPELGLGFLYLADFSIALIFAWLQGLQAAVPEYNRSFGYFAANIAVVGFIAAVLILAPILPVKRIAMLLPFSVLLLLRGNAPNFAEYCIQVVDVGQGSAVLVDTSAHRLAVDAGPVFRSGFDTASAAVIPTMRSTGRDYLNKILLSHTDIDHAGGVASLQRRYSSGPVLGLDKQCEDGFAWQWDGVEFQLAVDHSQTTTNDRSCTLLISNGHTTAYLSGDVGQKVEAKLIARLPRNIDFLLAPHHGSGSSSSYRFTRHLSPLWVVYSAGFANQYGHPHKRTVARYQLEGAVQLATAQQGALRWCSTRPKEVFSQRLGVLQWANFAGQDLLGVPND